MNCTPEKCPHRALLEKARQACLTCDHITPAGHGRVISYDSAGERIIERERVPAACLSGVCATKLPAAVENKLRLLLCTVSGLDTIDALLLLHVSNGGTCGNFGAYLRRLMASIKTYAPERPGFRATAHNRWLNLKGRFAPFGALQSWTPQNSNGAKVESKGLSGRPVRGDR